MWDERYRSVDFAYGLEPNDLLREQVELLGQKPGRALCLAEGEGRNGLYLARRGWDVSGVDQSRVGLDKFERRAADSGVRVTTIHADLNDFDLGTECWDLIVSIWCHVPPPLRRKLHFDVEQALVVGGVLILEAYHPRQLDFKTGGPPTAETMMTLADLREELPHLERLLENEIEREVHEGPFHDGPSAVTQLVARRA